MKLPEDPSLKGNPGALKGSLYNARCNHHGYWCNIKEKEDASKQVTADDSAFKVKVLDQTNKALS